EAAQHCGKVIAIDVSPRMLEFAQQKARMMGVTNVEFDHSGFLTYCHSGEPFDAVVSQLALHHLPDFWKIIALRRIFEMLKNGGKFYLRDTVYSFDVENHKDFFDNLIDRVKNDAGVEFACDFETATREEYTTLDWIMEGLLRRAGFYIDKADYFEGFMAVYVCTKL
ncbi:MAG: class I SAM-dependent methyltransferase, partial [Candidatus Methanoperedens sp.]|nr:class I SAM-dependent methyltransferase [Candidatus Methanoperedens sp.]